MAHETTHYGDDDIIEEAEQFSKLIVKKADIWFSANLNAGQTQNIIFSPMTTNGSVMLLGTQTDRKLKWHDHINILAKIL